MRKSGKINLVMIMLFLIMAVPVQMLHAALNKTVSVAIIDVVEIVRHSGDVPIPIGKSAIIKGVTSPEGRPLNWELVNVPTGVDVKLSKLDRGRCRIEVGEKSESEWITVKASDEEYPQYYKEARIYIGCIPCGGDGQCAVPGNGIINLSSINARFSLGKGKRGWPAGDLFIKSKQMSPELSTPAALDFSTLIKGVGVIRDENNHLRQVVAPQSFADIITISEFSYEIRFYLSKDIIGTENGLYQVDIFEKPFSIWRIENPDASPDKYDRLKITEHKGNNTRAFLYIWDSAASAWSLSRGNGAQVETRKETLDELLKNRIVMHAVKNEAGSVASSRRTTYHTFPWGEEIIEEVEDPDGAALTTTTTYYEDAGDSGSYKNVSTSIDPDGGWTKYYYDSEGRVVKNVASWLDADMDSPEDAAAVTEYDYTPVAPEDSNLKEDDNRARTVTNKINGRIVSLTYHAYGVNTDEERVEITETCSTPGAPYGDASGLRTVTTFYPESDKAAEERIKTVLYPDGRLDTYTYEKGSYTIPDPSLPGLFTVEGGNFERKTIVHGTATNPAGVAYKTTREVSVTGDTGNGLLEETHVYTGADYSRIHWEVKAYDDFGHVTKTIGSDGTQTDSVWGCCNRESATDAQGISSHFVYDDLKRVVQRTSQGLKGEITTSYTYDGAGRRLSKTVSATIALPLYPSFSAVIEIKSTEVEGTSSCRIKSANLSGTRKMVDYFQ